MHKIGVILSGCGVYDGAEIHESVLTLLYLQQQGINPVIMAPDVDQYHVINHQTGEEMKEKRNVLVEAARIARGEVLSLQKADPKDFDAIILPGGFGAAKNLCTFAFDGPDAKINEDVKSFLVGFKSLKRPIGAMCIAPAILALLKNAFGAESQKLTIGKDKGTAAGIEACGCNHQDCEVDEISVDIDNLLVTNPAYMLGENIAQIAPGIEKLVKKVIELI